ncbi:hypothetical protein MBANPS3_004262 [Mucor bainieri]
MHHHPQWLEEKYNTDNLVIGFFMKGGYPAKDKAVAELEFKLAVKNLEQRGDPDVKSWAENIMHTDFRDRPTGISENSTNNKIRVSLRCPSMMAFSRLNGFLSRGVGRFDVVYKNVCIRRRSFYYDIRIYEAEQFDSQNAILAARAKATCFKELAKQDIRKESTPLKTALPDPTYERFKKQFMVKLKVDVDAGNRCKALLVKLFVTENHRGVIRSEKKAVLRL